MKKHNGISLIETLISLAIVGISLIALLPVVTVKNEGNSIGNDYWAQLPGAADAPYTTKSNICQVIDAETLRMCPVRIGESGNIVDGYNFEIVNTGFENSSIPAIVATRKLHFNGMDVYADTIDTDNDGNMDASLFLSSAYSTNGLCSSNAAAYSTLYFDANSIIIQNDGAFDEGSICNYYTTNPQARISSENNTDFNSHPRGTNVYKISHNSTDGGRIYNDEYLFVNPAKNIAGVGQNAARYRDTDNFVGILNSGYIPPTGVPPMKQYPPSEANSRQTVAIGAIPQNTVDAVTYGTGANYALHYLGGIAADVAAGVPAVDPVYTIGAANFNVTNFTVRKILVKSDKRLKNIIGKYQKGLNEILKINPVLYNWKSDEKKITHVGVIAQDLKKIFPRSVTKNPQTGYLMIGQDEMFYALLNSIKELNNKNKSIEEENLKLEKKIAQLKAIRDNIKASKGGEL